MAIPPNMAATAQVSLKLFIDTKGQRVLFAEAGKEFVDFLLSIFTLPVGAITRLLKEGGGMAGCLPSLYQSFENMSVTHIQPGKDKRPVLEPKLFMPSPKLSLLMPNLGSTVRQLYTCPNGYNYRNCSSFLADDDSTICPSCDCKMDRIVKLVDPPSAARETSGSEEGYVKGTVTYIVMDGLELKVLSTIGSFVTLLKEINVGEIGDIEEKVVNVGMDEGVKLLQASLQSKTVLTDVFFSAEIIKTGESSSAGE